MLRLLYFYQQLHGKLNGDQFKQLSVFLLLALMPLVLSRGTLDKQQSLLSGEFNGYPIKNLTMQCLVNKKYSAPNES